MALSSLGPWHLREKAYAFIFPTAMPDFGFIHTGFLPMLENQCSVGRLIGCALVQVFSEISDLLINMITS
jgi:hypothetical protein